MSKRDHHQISETKILTVGNDLSEGKKLKKMTNVVTKRGYNGYGWVGVYNQRQCIRIFGISNGCQLQHKELYRIKLYQFKLSTLRNGGDDAVAETPPWNLRTRQAACNELGDEPTSIIGVNRGRNEGCSDGD
ncbi:unnamed protein product [Brassica oleracea]